MGTFIGSVKRPSGNLRPEVKSRLQFAGPVVATFDGWHTSTAVALYHLADCGRTDVLRRLPGMDAGHWWR